jgi:hypothetical protein
MYAPIFRLAFVSVAFMGKQPEDKHARADAYREDKYSYAC